MQVCTYILNSQRHHLVLQVTLYLYRLSTRDCRGFDEILLFCLNRFQLVIPVLLYLAVWRSNQVFAIFSCVPPLSRSGLFLSLRSLVRSRFTSRALSLCSCFQRLLRDSSVFHSHQVIKPPHLSLIDYYSRRSDLQISPEGLIPRTVHTAFYQ